MKKALMIAFLFFVAVSTVSAQQSFTATDADGSCGINMSTGTATPATSTQRVTVQKVAQPEPLTASQSNAVEAYLLNHRDKNSQSNRQALRAALTFLLGIKQSHTPLNRQPNDYLADYQLYTQTMEYTDMYVNLPGLPPFIGGGPQGPLVLADVPPCIIERSVAPCTPPGAVSISHPGDREETPIASGWKSWRKIPTPTCKPVPPTPVTCDPNGSPPAKPPTSAVH